MSGRSARLIGRSAAPAIEETPPTTARDGRHEIVILGGGVAGLTASMETGASVYEAADRVGGVAGSDSVAGFTFDRGIHVLQTRNQQLLDLLDKIGVRFRINQRIAHIYSHGCYSAYPFQVNSAGLPVRLRARCVRDFLRRSHHPEPSNYEEWIYRSVGTGFAETFLIPYSEKFWGVHPREMTFAWAGNRVPQPNTWQVLRGALINRQTQIGTNVSFRYPERGPGYQAISRALAQRCGTICLSHRATRLEALRHKIVFNGTKVVNYEVLLSTIALPELIALAVDAPAAVRAAAAMLRTNSIFVVNLGISRANLSEKHWVHFPEKDISFFRISFPHNFADDLAPPGTSSISAEVSYPGGEKLDADWLVERVIADLHRTGVLRMRDRILATATYDIKYAYCIYDFHRDEALRTITTWLDSVDIVPSGRYGLWTYFWSDESILSGRRSAQDVLKRLNQTAMS
jgi:protoporphyrinogen oxidase